MLVALLLFNIPLLIVSWTFLIITVLDGLLQYQQREGYVDAIQQKRVEYAHEIQQERRENELLHEQIMTLKAENGTLRKSLLQTQGVFVDWPEPLYHTEYQPLRMISIADWGTFRPSP